MNILKGLSAPVLVSILLSSCSTTSSDYSKDKYYTWVDEQGRVQHTLIKKEENPLIKNKEALTNQSAEKSTTSTEISTTQTDNQLRPSELQLEKNVEDEVMSKTPVIDPSADEELSSDSVVSTSKPVSSSDSETKAISDGSTQRKNDQYDATKINESDYIDGDELAKNNYIRPGDEQRYYTWVDGEGRMVNSPFNPNDSEVVSDNKVVKRFITPLKPEVSKAIISSANMRTPLTVDPKASEIFGLNVTSDNGESWYQSMLTDECCTDLSYNVLTELDMDEDMLIELNFMSERHPFKSGDSAYEVVLLPVANRDYYLRVRTFFKDSVFIPTLVFLDENLAPTRLIQDISLTYTKETGSSYAYLEGIVNVEYQTRKERFFVLLTTDHDLEKITIVDTKKQKLKQITHAPLGSVGVFAYP